MSRIWKGLWAVVALTSMVAASSASLAYAQEESAPAASEVEQKDEENAPAASELRTVTPSFVTVGDAVIFVPLDLAVYQPLSV